MKPERIRERMQPLLQPLREAAEGWEGYRRLWPIFSTSAGETFVHAIAAMVVVRNPRLGADRLLQSALAAARPAWLTDLVTQMDAYVEDMKDEDRNVPLRSVVFRDQNGGRYGTVSMRTTRAQIGIFAGGKDAVPMWLSRRSFSPILDPDTVDLTADDCGVCIDMLRRELADAGAPGADTMAINFGRQVSGGHGHFIQDMRSRTIRAAWSDDETAMSITVPGHDLSQPNRMSMSIVRLDAYSIVHGPLPELRSRMRWHARHVASMMSARDGLLSEMDAVRDMIADAARAKGAPDGGIVESCRITQAGTALQVECGVIGYDRDSFRRKVQRTTFSGATCREIEKAARYNLERACSDYARHGRRTGSPPYVETSFEQVDLGAYLIDLPLARLIEARLPGRLREIASTLVVRGYVPEDVRPGSDGPMNGVSIHLERGCIRGYFDLSPAVSWRAGKVRMVDLSLPQSLRTSLTGTSLADAVRHELFDDILRISSTSTRDTAGGGQVTYLHIGNATERLMKMIEEGGLMTR